MSQTVINTYMPIAFAGLLADNADNDNVSRVSSEASAEIPFGVMLADDPAGDEKGKLPSASTDKFAGVVLHSHAYLKDTELGSTGLKPKTAISALRKGRVWVQVEEIVAKGDRAFIRYAGVGQKGAFRKSAVVGETIDASAIGRFMTSAAASGFAVVEIDLTGAF